MSAGRELLPSENSLGHMVYARAPGPGTVSWSPGRPLQPGNECDLSSGPADLWLLWVMPGSHSGSWLHRGLGVLFSLNRSRPMIGTSFDPCQEELPFAHL